MASLLQQWIDTASQAPSGDNCQPWDLSFSFNQFRISINLERAENFLDQNLSASWIALGCFCENLMLSAAHFGFQCQFNIESKTSVLVSYDVTTEKPNAPLIEAIYNRQTYRVPLGTTDVNLLEQYSQRYKSQNIRPDFVWKTTQNISWRRSYQWAWIEGKIWLKTSLIEDFTRYLHLRANSDMVDGLTLENLNVPFMDSLILRICKRIPSFIRLTPFPLFIIQTLFRIRSLVRQSSGLVYLSGRFQSHPDYFAAGREIQRMWVLMAEKDIKAQPMAMQSLFLNFVNSGQTWAFFKDQEISKLSAIKAETFADLNVQQDLIFMFRYGTSSAKIQHLPRRPITVPEAQSKSQSRMAAL